MADILIANISKLFSISVTILTVISLENISYQMMEQQQWWWLYQKLEQKPSLIQN